MSQEAKRKFTYNPTTAMAIATVAGIVAGVVFGSVMTDIKFIGDIFFRLIQMGIVPFVMCLIVEAIGSLSLRQLSNIGLKAVLLFLLTSFLAAVFGMLLGVVFHPGAGLSNSALVLNATTDVQAAQTSWQETLTNFFPSNIISSVAQGSVVQCIVFSVFLGVAIVLHREKTGKDGAVFTWVCELSQLLLGIIKIVMNAAPIGIFAYVSASIGALGFDMLIPIAKYIVVLAFGVAAFLLVFFFITAFICRLSPFKLIKKMGRTMLFAATTISSAVTLPIEMEDCKEKVGLDREVANLVLPLGVSLNSNGSALHMALTAMFVSQMYGMDFSGASLITVVLISFALSMATAAAPGASLISLTMLIPALGLPLDAIAILGGLEYLVASTRTTLNVVGDALCALIVAKSQDGIDYDVFNGSDVDAKQLDGEVA